MKKLSILQKAFCFLIIFAMMFISYTTTGQNTSNQSGWIETPSKEVYKTNLIGNVGVGTMSPTEKLHVNGNIRVEALEDNNPKHLILPKDKATVLEYLSFVLADKDGVLKRIPFETLKAAFVSPDRKLFGPDTLTPLSLSKCRDDCYWKLIGNFITNTDTSHFLGTVNERNLDFRTFGTLRMRIHSDGFTQIFNTVQLQNNCNVFNNLNVQGGSQILGDVAIGTGAPESGYKLTVCGQIKAHRVRVDTWGCDFVFDDEYNLMSLPELEKYIQKNNHLPLIPPATEVEKEGMDIGDMQSLLLQKVEELTLYVIQQNKRLTEVENENIELQKQVEQLKVGR